MTITKLFMHIELALPRILTIVLIYLSLNNHALAAADSMHCSEPVLASAEARNVLEGDASLQSTDFNKDQGTVRAQYQNGDVFIAHFDQCALGISAQLLIREKVSNQELRKRLLDVISKMPPSKVLAEQIREQAKQHSTEDFKNGVILSSANGEHEIVVKNASSPIFYMEVHYQWFPPTH